MIEQYCLKDDLSTYDPYDVWSTEVGFGIKRFYNINRKLGFFPAAILAMLDRINVRRWFCCKREYPIVRAMAAQILLSVYERTQASKYLESANKHLEWLVAHKGKGYIGSGWGVLIHRTVDRTLIYDANAVFSSVTPYCLDAFLAFRHVTNESRYDEEIENIFRFFEKDICIMLEDDTRMATSYSAMADRIIVNALSYTLYALSLSVQHNKYTDANVLNKIRKLYNFIKAEQRDDGSWLYAYDNPKSFIDCFHSCIVLKNIYKASAISELPESKEVLVCGWKYIKNSMYDSNKGLFKRFSITNKPGMVKYDLYDNAEALNVAVLLGDHEMADCLICNIKRYFCKQAIIYSRIDKFGRLNNANYLRWAVMPYLLSYCNYTELL